MKRAIPTLSFAVFIASVFLFASVPPTYSAAPVTPKTSPSAAKATKVSATSQDVCASTKSKWAHIQCEQFNASAPGDEYFGRMKMSYLGIDNTYKDGAISAGAYSTDPRLIAKLDFATEALRRWAAKYPHDPQLPRSYFLGIQVLRKMYTQTEQQTAWEFMQILVTKYPATYFGKLMKATLAHGYTEHWFGLAQLCPTPLPLGVSPDATPGDTPIPSPAPGRPAIDIITPPCVQPSNAPDVDSPATATIPGPTLSPYPSPTKL